MNNMSGLIEYFAHHMLICDDELFDKKAGNEEKKSEFNNSRNYFKTFSLLILD